MKIKIHTTLLAFVLTLIFILTINVKAQVIRATGNATEASSQLIYYYDVFGPDSVIQLTNTNDTVSVWVHVQIFRSYDADPQTAFVDPVRCEERNFVDFLTPNDTHVYSLDEENFPKNIGETEADPGEATTIDLSDPDSKGFVIVTPVVSESDFTAISFQHLIGTSMSDQDLTFLSNAMGRDAVDLVTGEVLPDGTTLDGVSTGFVTLQPDELLFDFGFDGDIDVVGIAFNDVYGPPGLLGYEVTPGSANLTSFIFDFKEDPTSCGNQTIDCFYLSGLNDTHGLSNEIFIPSAGEDNLLCEGAVTPEYDPGDESNFSAAWDFFGWTRVFVSGLGNNTNVLGFTLNSCCDSKWMNTDSNNVEAQATVAPTGISTRASSQLVYYYDVYDVDTEIQVTNTNDTEPVTIHVQIFRNFDPDDDASSSSTADPVFCDERNFFDILTPNDTHIYDVDETNFPKNVGETEDDAGESTSINLTTPQDSKGFIVITPVVSEADATAKSWQYMIGTVKDSGFDFGVMNAMGRDAVDLTTGEILPDNTVLDGVTAGFVQLQPEELLFNFASNNDEFDVIGIAFSDVYGPQGLLGYNIAPATHTWTSFIFDFKEDPTSCGIRQVGCFLTLGLNDTHGQLNEIFTQNGAETVPDDLLCAGSETPEYDPPTETANFDNQWQRFGWGRIFVSGIGEFDNHIALVVNEADAGADYMHVRGERVEPSPTPTDEDCSVEGDEDEDGFADCLDTDCAADESCETGEEECADEMDNDEDGQADCADLGCDGFAGCEFGEETSCDDGIDNDADGAVDGDDEDCMEADTGGDGDGGGCVVAGNSTASTSAVNFLILMLPFIGAFGIRRIRKEASR